MYKKKLGKHLQFYMDCMTKGCMDDFGLCNALKSKDTLDLFLPTDDDIKTLKEEGLSVLYWGSGLSLDNKYDHQRYWVLTPLRQTIVLFMAAINNEL